MRPGAFTRIWFVTVWVSVRMTSIGYTPTPLISLSFPYVLLPFTLSLSLPMDQYPRQMAIREDGPPGYDRNGERAIKHRARLARIDARHRWRRKHCHLCHGLPRFPLRCARCRNARYCTKDCQSRHWSVHKAECKENGITMQARYNAGQSCGNCRLLSPTAVPCNESIPAYPNRIYKSWYCSQDCLVMDRPWM
jgi:hypothetical protein